MNAHACVCNSDGTVYIRSFAAYISTLLYLEFSLHKTILKYDVNSDEVQ